MTWFGNVAQILAISAAIISLGITNISWAENVTTVTHYQNHTRYAFGLSVLELALQKSGGTFQLSSQPQHLGLNEKRGEMLVVEGKLDLQFQQTTPFREQNMIAVKIPIYRGLLGARLLLVQKKNKYKLARISKLSELRNFVGGHGLHWGDLPVYAENNLPVITSALYDALFRMLKVGRFDYFHRGINEIWGEHEQHQSELAIAKGVLLFYSHPVYFFVTKDKPELAEAIKKGFTIAIEDGSFKRLFDAKYSELVRKADLESRNLILLKNPVPPACTPAIDISWWAPAKFTLQLKQYNKEMPCTAQ